MSKEDFYISEYNRLAFLSPIVIDTIDNLEGSNQYKLELKYHLRRAMKECEKIHATHYKHFQDQGIVHHPTDGNAVDALDIYNITAKAYDYLLRLNPNEIASIVQIVKKAKERGIDLSEVNIEYEPILK